MSHDSLRNSTERAGSVTVSPTFTLTGTVTKGGPPAPKYALPANHPARIVFEQSVLAFLQGIDTPSSDPDGSDHWKAFSRMREAATDLQAAKRVAIIDGPRTSAIATEKREAAQADAQVRLLQDVASAVGVTLTQLARFGPGPVSRTVGLVKPDKTPPTPEQLAELFKRPEFNQGEYDTAAGTVGQDAAPPIRLLLQGTNVYEVGPSTGQGGKLADGTNTASSEATPNCGGTGSGS